MHFKRIIAASALTGAILFSGAIHAQEANDLVTSEEVKTDISQAMEAVGKYSVQEKDEALAAVREGLQDLDAEIDRREAALRESWDSLEDGARDEYAEAVSDLRAARNHLGERVGALEAGSEDAWGDLTEGFTRAYADFKARWKEADGE